jgi:hypothetical protein
MKTQLAALCLGERRFLQIRLHLHEDIRSRVGDELLKEYARDRLTRCLGENFDEVPWFYIVIEDRDTDGETAVRPHLHGAIEIPRMPVPRTKAGEPKARYRRLINDKGLEEAEFLAGREIINRVLRQATGNDRRRAQVVNGVSQLNNVWKRKPYNLLFNVEAVSYALKNMHRVSPSLTKNRLSISRDLRQEAQRLWALIREGESALSLWP